MRARHGRRGPGAPTAPTAPRAATVSVVANTIADAGADAARWALARATLGDQSGAETEDAAARALRSVTMPTTREQLHSMLDEGGYLPDDMLDAAYVPAFVKERLYGRLTQPAPPRNPWIVSTFRAVSHDRVVADLCVVGDSAASLEHDEPRSLMRTLLFGLDCVLRLVEIVHPGFSHRVPRSLVACVVLLPEQRGLPDGACRPVEPEHLNAGVTDTNAHRILVFRAQHVHKVLLHELIHCMGLDAAMRDGLSERASERQVMRELQLRPRSGTLRASETYVELLACFWHLYLHIPAATALAAARAEPPDSLDAPVARPAPDGDRPSKKSASVAALRRKVRSLWKAERNTYYRAVALVMDYYIDCDIDDDAPTSFPEGTHLFSYIVGKAALWSRLNRVPALPTSRTEASSFLDEWRDAATDPQFWQEVARSKPASRLLMTGLSI